jgi:hypothetical protein
VTTATKTIDPREALRRTCRIAIARANNGVYRGTDERSARYRDTCVHACRTEADAGVNVLFTRNAGTFGGLLPGQAPPRAESHQWAGLTVTRTPRVDGAAECWYEVQVSEYLLQPNVPGHMLGRQRRDGVAYAVLQNLLGTATAVALAGEDGPDRRDIVSYFRVFTTPQWVPVKVDPRPGWAAADPAY